MKNYLLLSIIIVLFLLTPNRSFAQTCLTVTQGLLASAFGERPAGADGLIHASYAFVDSGGNAMTPTATVGSSAANALSEWNAFSSTTGVQFDPLPSNQAASTADLQFQSTTDTSAGGCAAFSAGPNRIYYGSTFLSISNVSTGTTIFAHELGHQLGLADGGTNPSPTSIMNNPSNALPQGCTSPQIPTSTVQPTDASKIPSCRQAALAYVKSVELKLKETTKVNPNPFYDVTTNGPTTCTYTYYTVNYYVDGEYDSSEQFLAGYSCN